MEHIPADSNSIRFHNYILITSCGYTKIQNVPEQTTNNRAQSSHLYEIKAREVGIYITQFGKVHTEKELNIQATNNSLCIADANGSMGPDG